MIALTEKPEASSDRLEKLLTKRGSFKTKGHGLTEEIKLIAGVSYTTARKWLYENALPRTSEERMRVADVLNIDLLYWEYGFHNQEKSTKPFETDYLFHMKVANMVMGIIHEDKLTISPDKVIEIELVALELAKSTKNPEPDINIITSLIKLAV